MAIVSVLQLIAIRAYTLANLSRRRWISGDGQVTTGGGMARCGKGREVELIENTVLVLYVLALYVRKADNGVRVDVDD